MLEPNGLSQNCYGRGGEGKPGLVIMSGVMPLHCLEDIRGLLGLPAPLAGADRPGGIPERSWRGPEGLREGLGGVLGASWKGLERLLRASFVQVEVLA